MPAVSSPAAAILVFVLTVTGILWRPFRLHEAWFAVAGAVVMLASGMVRPEALAAVLGQTAPVLLFLAGVLIIGAVAEKAGVFTWAALWTARLAGASARRLFVAVYSLGIVITSLFSLDATAVVLTPVVFSVVREGGLPALPFLCLCTYVANTASLLFPVSNLTNLLVQARFDLPFWEFARIMSLPAALAAGANLGLLYLYFRRELVGRLDVESLEVHVRVLARSPFLRWSLLLASLTLVGFGVAGWLRVPLWPIALGGGAAMAALGTARREVRPSFFVRGIAWGLLPFVVGLFVVIQGVQDAGAGRRLLDLALAPRAFAGAAWGVASPGTGEASDPGAFAGVVGLSLLAAVGSNLINNIPMTLLGMGAIGQAGALPPSAPYALLLGVNIGPNLTIIGSLATMLALGIIRQKGVDVTGWQYLRVGLVMMPPVLLAAIAGLWLATL